MTRGGVLFWRDSPPFTHADLDIFGQAVGGLPGLRRTELAGSLWEVVRETADPAWRDMGRCSWNWSDGLVLAPVKAQPALGERTDLGRPAPLPSIAAFSSDLCPITVALVEQPSRDLWNATMARCPPGLFPRPGLA